MFYKLSAVKMTSPKDMGLDGINWSYITVSGHFIAKLITNKKNIYQSPFIKSSL